MTWAANPASGCPSQVATGHACQREFGSFVFRSDARQAEETGDESDFLCRGD
jgi:hypothetical protein